MTQRAILCPRCRRLIGSDESSCSWCGAARPAAWRQATARVWGRHDGVWVVKAIITVNIVFYLLSLLLSSHGGSSVNPFSLLSPDQTSLLLLGGTGTIPIDRFGRYWTVLSANYLHGGIIHILFNLMALRQIAPWVSQEYGDSRMFIIYTVGGVCGYVVSYLAGVPLTIGASAAICGLIGALLYFGRSRGGMYGTAVYREVSGWVISLFIFGLLMPGINNWGHGGGILGGIVMGKLLGYGEQGAETALHRALALLCAFLTGVVLVWAAFGAFLLWSR
ncbi:MAG TPA: rhomboid family intramembrane serine protease [Geobacteraceae bacterium]